MAISHAIIWKRVPELADTLEGWNVARPSRARLTHFYTPSQTFIYNIQGTGSAEGGAD